MSFLRHAGIYRSDVVHKTITTWGGVPPPAGRPPAPVQGRDGRNYAPCSSSAMSSRAGYSLAGCSPAEPASASPTASSMGWGITAGNESSANGNLSLVSVSQPRGSLHYWVGIVGRRYEWRQEPARNAGGSARRRECLPRFWGERRISGISTVADQSHRSGHSQPKCLHDLQEACEAGALVLGRLIALHLLRLDPKAAR